jgi:hypothetical protein
MSDKNTAVFGLYPDETEVVEAIEQLKRAGFRAPDFRFCSPKIPGQRTLATRSIRKRLKEPLRAASPEP